MDKYHFQYCQKLVVFTEDFKKVLLCKRKGENDYDGVFSFIGGKMEITDSSLIEGMAREKSEEIGKKAQVKLFPTLCTNLNNIFVKKDGNKMILPHYLCIYLGGEIEINDEYSEYKWVTLDELKSFEPKINNIPEIVSTLLRLRELIKEEEFITI